jgi:hypothetical protein
MKVWFPVLAIAAAFSGTFILGAAPPLQAQASAEMVSAVEEKGLTAETYNAIFFEFMSPNTKPQYLQNFLTENSSITHTKALHSTTRLPLESITTHRTALHDKG